MCALEKQHQMNGKKLNINDLINEVKSHPKKYNPNPEKLKEYKKGISTCGIIFALMIIILSSYGIWAFGGIIAGACRLNFLNEDSWIWKECKQIYESFYKMFVLPKLLTKDEATQLSLNEEFDNTTYHGFKGDIKVGGKKKISEHLNEQKTLLNYLIDDENKYVAGKKEFKSKQRKRLENNSQQTWLESFVKLPFNVFHSGKEVIEEGYYSNDTYYPKMKAFRKDKLESVLRAQERMIKQIQKNNLQKYTGVQHNLIGLFSTLIFPFTRKIISFFGSLLYAGFYKIVYFLQWIAESIGICTAMDLQSSKKPNAKTVEKKLQKVKNVEKEKVLEISLLSDI